MNRILTATALAAGLLLGACASRPTITNELVDARASVRSAEADPAVLAHAPLELKKATDTLNRANVMSSHGDPASEVSSVAYIANQQARTAIAVAQSKGNEDAIKSAEADRERARGDVRTAQAQAQAGVARQQAAAAEQRASTAEQQAAAAQANANEAQLSAAQLQARLNELQAQQTERGLLVTLGDVLFEFNRAEIKPTAQESLRKLADFLQQYPTRRVLIEGHTDNIGSAPYNEALSLRRADAVAAALLNMGVVGQRVTIVGYGKDFPIADNSSDSNRALNRRVEVYISESDQPVRRRG